MWGGYHTWNLSVLDVRKQYHIKISIRFPALENFIGSEYINRAYKNSKRTIEISAK
jgi:hypothetical protein